MSDAKELCINLIEADTEERVIQLLKEHGYWDDPSLWRYYGDYENNYNTIGNQQSRPEAALVEKLVNSVDARLMNECLIRGIAPEGSDAPKNIRAAVASFFDDIADPNSSLAGQIKNWTDTKRTKIARAITLAATGAKGNPCFTISDEGEGQTPEMMPATLLSLTKSNKLRIPFVQGKFNMGGTGAFKFCGRHGLQLIVTRRNPAIVSDKFDQHSDSQWGFTIVRREDPEGGRRSSVYTYLAPLGAASNRGKGGVLRFDSKTMPILPERREPYARNAGWGTLIKLYEYGATGFRSNIIFSGGGLLSRIDLLLPDIALPVRLYECRTYGGHSGSFETTLTGVGTRLEDDKSNNLEDGFPSSCPLSARGEQMTATIYAFKKGKSDTYRKNEGIIFTLNGQTHGNLTTDFFRRTKLGLSYLRDSILVMVDCTRFSGRAREDLFMNSRDRISGGDLRAELERALEVMLRHHQGLRELKERRRREETESMLSDSKPLEEILKSILKQSPSLANLFLPGKRVTNPFKTRKVQETEEEFRGRKHPTFFKFKDLDYGKVLKRQTPINMRIRVTFETDAINDYFSRSIDPGAFELCLVTDQHLIAVQNYVGPNLQNGHATLSVELPRNCRVGDELSFLAVVSDPTLVSEFENTFRVLVNQEATSNGRKTSRNKSSSGKAGKDADAPAGITLPNIVEVDESEWEKQSPTFDKYTALRIKNAGSTDDGDGETSEENADSNNGNSVYDFFVNMDNVHLKTELKSRFSDTEITRSRFKYALVLIGLALLQEEQAKKNSEPDQEEDDTNEVNIEDRVEQFSKAVAPILLPMINSLGELEIEEESVMAVDGSGESV